MTETCLHLIDIGINLTNNSFTSDLDQVLARAQQAGVATMVVTGTDLQESEKALELCQHYPQQLVCTAGVHPHDAKSCDGDWLRQLAALAREDAVRALGETGLDFNRNYSPPEQQIKVFEQQLELAAELGLPLFMHERDAHKQFHDMIRYYRDDLGDCVLHCFTGSKEELYACLDLDLHIGITGWICDERRGAHLLPLLKDIPLPRLMLETDGPYLLPRNLPEKPKNRRNEPANLPHICRFAAEHMSLSTEQLAQATTATATAFFRL